MLSLRKAPEVLAEPQAYAQSSEPFTGAVQPFGAACRLPGAVSLGKECQHDEGVLREVRCEQTVALREADETALEV
jgi:hypothetical protein